MTGEKLSILYQKNSYCEKHRTLKSDLNRATLVLPARNMGPEKRPMFLTVIAISFYTLYIEQVGDSVLECTTCGKISLRL